MRTIIIENEDGTVSQSLTIRGTVATLHSFGPSGSELVQVVPDDAMPMIVYRFEAATLGRYAFEVGR